MLKRLTQPITSEHGEGKKEPDTFEKYCEKLRARSSRLQERSIKLLERSHKIRAFVEIKPVGESSSR